MFSYKITLLEARVTIVLFSSCCRINFLKYQPPPKNLDYLQRSEVYRLVHDMEPPIKGIARRPSKILSEQDYYEKVVLCLFMLNMPLFVCYCLQTEHELEEDKKQ